MDRRVAAAGAPLKPRQRGAKAPLAGTKGRRDGNKGKRKAGKGGENMCKTKKFVQIIALFPLYKNREDGI